MIRKPSMLAEGLHDPLGLLVISNSELLVIQGAVFRFSQGLEAGVNRICRGPDRALYIGEVGMLGGWSWKEKQYGLQRMKYNGKLTFEMLAIRAKPKGFEIEFTEPLDSGERVQASDFFLQQWWGGICLLQNMVDQRWIWKN